MFEQMTYKMQPAGHEQPKPKRSYTEPSSQLKHAFETWLKEWDHLIKKGEKHTKTAYLNALQMLKDVNPSVAEAHGLLIGYNDVTSNKKSFEGVFISAVYAKTPDKHIVFDLDLEKRIHYLGLYLPKDKVFINKGFASQFACEESKGIIINQEGAKLFAGSVEKAAGIINYGNAYFGSSSARPPFILNFGRADIDHSTQSLDILIFNYQEPNYSFKGLNKKINCGDLSPSEIPELMKYAEDLKKQFEPGRNDYKFALEEFERLGPHPIEKIRENVEAILRRAGYA